jgi:carbon-monoxide dehydrogenase large subunit
MGDQLDSTLQTIRTDLFRAGYLCDHQLAGSIHLAMKLERPLLLEGDAGNFTYPFGIYLCVVDIDKGTGESSIRRFYALDDCGTRINPMIIDGQIHGGLTEGFAVAMGQQMPFDEQGNLMGNTLMDYFLPTAVETPTWETDYTVTPSPHHPIGAKGVAESPHVGSIPTFNSAVVDAFAHLGVTHMDMPHTSYRVWKKLKEEGVQL